MYLGFAFGSLGFLCGQLGVNFLPWVAAPQGLGWVGEPMRSRKNTHHGVLAVGSSSVSVKTWCQLCLEAFSFVLDKCEKFSAG